MSAASFPGPARALLVRRVASFVALTKPRILPLVIFTALPVLLMAKAGLAQSLGILAGISLAAAAANALNMYVERDRDALMERTRSRPLPTAEVAPRAALRFGLVLSGVATVALQLVAGAPAALLGVASILFYVFVYTIWLKPRTPYNAVIGGAAGAAAPLIADAAVNGSVGWPGLLLFSIVFFWQPPHVWAIALYRKSDYAAAGIPMMPAVVGDERTRRRMLWYTLGLLPVTILPAVPPIGLLGPVYLCVAVALGAWFTWSCVRLIRERSDAAAQRVFRVSLVYLAGLYLAMLVDLLAAPAFSS
jgi:protoheme IX farnesyltransferase